jgi:hypothetical protein
MKKKFMRMGVLVVLGMFVLAAYLPTSVAAGVSSANSMTVTIDSDNDSDIDVFAVWHDGSPSGGPPAEELFRVQENGNVGIGVNDPQHKLDVAGTVQMTGFKMPTGAVEGYVLTSDASGVGTWQLAPGGWSGSGTINYITKFTGSSSLGDSVICENSGNIGIGTTSPSGKLDVVGNIVVSGTVDGVDIDVAVANLIASDLALQVNIDSEEAARIAADILLQSNIDSETAARIAADVALQVNIDAEETARIAADITLQNNINSEEAARIAADNTLQINIDNLAAIDAMDYDSLADLENAVAHGFNIATLSGNVGIGIASPTQKLDINGGLRVRDLPQDDNLDEIVVADADGVLHVRDSKTIGFVTNIITVDKDYIPVDSDFTILVDASSNHVRIKLPEAEEVPGQILNIKRMDDHKKNNVIINPHGSEKIDGDLMVKLNTKYMSYTIQSDGSDWYIITSYGFMGQSHLNNKNR